MKRIYSIPCSLSSSDPVDFKWQNKKSKYLAAATESTVNVYNRHGEHVDQLNLFGYCSCLSWDTEGDWLAIITNRSPLIFLWNSTTHRLQQIDSGMKETLSLLQWSRTSHSILIGTVKGNILIYNNQTSRKIPVIGKHNKRIVGCDWSDNNLVALVGDDKLLTISNEEGESVSIISLKGEGSSVKFLHTYYEEKNNSNEANCVAVVLNKKMLFFVHLNDSENPFVLNFQDWYESIVDYYCYPSGNLFAVFSSGLVVTISTCMKSFGSELFQVKAHKDLLNTFSVCSMSNRVATCSENTIKIFDLSDHNEIENVLTVDDEPSIVALDWTSDGQLLAAVSSSGNIHVYLSQLKILGDSYGTSLAFLSSLLEVTVFNVHEEVQDSVIIIRVEIEPSHIAVGPFHLAVAMNNKIWFYSLTGNELINLLTAEREYVGIVRDIKLNGSYVAVLFTNGTLQLHLIEPNNKRNFSNHQLNVFVYPDGSEAATKNNNVSSLCLTNDFLIYALENGSLIYFVIEDWNSVIVYRHPHGIHHIEANFNGTRLVLLDQRNEAFVYNVYSNSIIQIASEHVPPKPIKVLWESWINDKCVFIICDLKFIYVYSAPRDTIKGPQVEYVGKMKIPSGQFPLLLYNGVIVCQTKSGKTSNFVLSTHDYTIKINSTTDTFHRDVFSNIIKLRRYQDAAKICSFLNNYDLWQELAKAAIFDLEIDIAIRVYKQIRQFGLAQCLIRYRNEEEQNLLCGLLAELIGQYDLAQKLFLVSSNPTHALEMRKNLLQWDEALALARHLSPHEIHVISRELAQHQEYAQEYRKALENFELALNGVDHNLEQNKNHIKQCKAGICRNAIQCGDIAKGLTMTLEIDEPQLIYECAVILEKLKHYQEAAQMYEKCNKYNQAAELYLKAKNSVKLNNLLPQITDSDILGQYARMKENEKQYRSALDIYSRAQQWIEVVRINLDHLNNPGEAVRIVREHGSAEGAKLVAKFFQRRNDMSTAIEFLVMSHCYEEAYSLAQTTGQMDVYADIMENYVNENLTDFRTIAIYYEQVNDTFKAGKFYCIAKQYKKGIKLLLDAASNSPNHENDSLSLAIDAAASAADEQITRLIIDFLMGETDGLPKDFKYLFRLYMKLHYYREAAKTAVVIAREEQNLGNYRNSHQLLFGMCSELRRNSIAIPSEMAASLMLIHTYMLAKLWVRAGDHKHSCKLLVRVSDNITKFPAHSLQILTTLVIQCLRAGFSKNSLKYACILMRPENRDKVDPKFKKKIENLVRKSPTTQLKADELRDELGFRLTTCPYCGEKVYENEFTCFGCRNSIPFCIASGMHVEKDELTSCPRCNMPAMMSPFLKVLALDTLCPMCGDSVEVAQMKTVLSMQDIFDVNQSASDSQ